ncbi:hypothetical protein RBA41_14020 [Massilia sp. CCM 9210]|uniref:hypothetical protein n=1 Tax=Massilia scottii TaxID=3057166 RepID=UPI002796DCDC|nr:hypothetical protein [Massilia sp. CCM 9210]MDQ1814424.1 hypothetical protein [Massilia sp. CCM 9210]
MSLPNYVSGPYTCESLTERSAELISHFMVEARRYSDLEARLRRERAYGVYMGWRTLVMDSAAAGVFAADDRRLEELLS